MMKVDGMYIVYLRAVWYAETASSDLFPLARVAPNLKKGMVHSTQFWIWDLYKHQKEIFNNLLFLSI